MFVYGLQIHDIETGAPVPGTLFRLNRYKEAEDRLTAMGRDWFRMHRVRIELWSLGDPAL